MKTPEEKWDYLHAPKDGLNPLKWIEPPITEEFRKQISNKCTELLKKERNKAIDLFYELMCKELETEPINRARYMNRLHDIKEKLKQNEQ